MEESKKGKIENCFYCGQEVGTNLERCSACNMFLQEKNWNNDAKKRSGGNRAVLLPD